MSSGNNIETEYLRINSKNEWSAVYTKIRVETTRNSAEYSEALKPQNKNLNRYRDVNPYDHSRIVLKRGSTDYINANLTKVTRANRQYILTQGPLSNTVSHFWLMVWEQKSKAVLMLNKLIEKKMEKCYQYWPAKVGPDYKMTMEDVGLTLEYLEQQDHAYYLKRVLRLTDIESKTSRDVLHFHYTTWPDFGVPTSPTAFLEFLRKVRAEGVLEEDVGPAVVHCSAGIGRSGTFCLVDSCLVLIEREGLNSVDVKEVLYEMRGCRMGLIQTAEQLRFSYQAIIEGAKQLVNPRSSPVVCTEENPIEFNSAGESETDSDDDGPPPLPPPRGESLKNLNGGPIDRPVPPIPRTVSSIEEYIPSRPLPVVPADEEEGSSEDELLEEGLPERPCSEASNPSESASPSELRHRKRVEHKEKLVAQVRDMKRRQQINEQWTHLKRSLYKPLLIAGTFLVGGGIVAYFYLKD